MSDTPPAATSKSPGISRRARGWALCLIATLALVADAAQAALSVRDVVVSLDDDVYELDARIDLTLPDDARRAIESGLTMRLDYEIVLDRVRRYMPDAEIAALTQSYEVNYHALSQRYLVRNLNTGEQQDFGSLQGALDRICDLHGLPILDEALVYKGPVYEGRIRAVLDLSTAPDALGWLLFWADDWSETSDWKTWTLRP
jgi:hypothetical protein